MGTSDKNYIAITIGPILDAMSASTKPVGLWAASYMFSALSRLLCLKIRDQGISPEAFVTPYFPDPKNDREEYTRLFERKDGVGLFHDHIIFAESGNIFALLPGIKEEAISEIAETFGIPKEFLLKYVMVAAARVRVGEGQNPILCAGKILDCLELPGAFAPESEGGEMAQALANKATLDHALNELRIAPAAWQLVYGSGKIKDLKHIALAGGISGLKKDKYYCILRADGDNMSQILKVLKAPEGPDRHRELREFSRACFDYSEEAAKLIGDYGGVTVYAGGDDLLALLPCEGTVSQENKAADGNGTVIEKVHGSVLGLVASIRRAFSKCFAGYIDNKDVSPKPSVSFGIFISYYKYPLYEALERSLYLLFDLAKSGSKNRVALEVQKHSGQSSCITVEGEQALKKLEDLLSYALGNRPAEPRDKDAPATGSKSDAEEKDECLLSVRQNIDTFHALIDRTPEGNVTELFKNLFDSGYHFENADRFLHKELPEFYKSCCLSCLIRTVGTGDTGPAMTLGQTLRIIRFYLEKKDETERNDTEEEPDENV